MRMPTCTCPHAHAHTAAGALPGEETAALTLTHDLSSRASRHSSPLPSPVLGSTSHSAKVPVLPGDIVWTVEKIVSTQGMSVVVGVIAGLLGLGGGELMAPLLVSLGLLPEVVSPVNAFMIFFTAAAVRETARDCARVIARA